MIQKLVGCGSLDRILIEAGRHHILERLGEFVLMVLGNRNRFVIFHLNKVLEGGRELR